jgi:hypothetical protein
MNWIRVRRDGRMMQDGQDGFCARRFQNPLIYPVNPENPVILSIIRFIRSSTLYILPGFQIYSNNYAEFRHYIPKFTLKTG